MLKVGVKHKAITTSFRLFTLLPAIDIPVIRAVKDMQMMEFFTLRYRLGEKLGKSLPNKSTAVRNSICTWS